MRHSRNFENDAMGLSASVTAPSSLNHAFSGKDSGMDKSLAIKKSFLSAILPMISQNAVDFALNATTSGGSLRQASY